METFIEYLNKQNEKKTVSGEVPVQDQDTAVSDIFCCIAQFIYDIAVDTARCIAENSQFAVDVKGIRMAELGMAYINGLDYGLGIDQPEFKWYANEIAKCMKSIEESRDNGFQTPIFVPQPPGDILNFREEKVRGSDWFKRQLSPKVFDKSSDDMVKRAIAETDHLDYLFRKGILKYEDFPMKKMPPPEDKADAPSPAKDSLPPVESRADLKEKVESGKKSCDAVVEDDLPQINNLKNLMRSGRIDKSQFIGSLATLLATGLITKGQFTRLKNGV